MRALARLSGKEGFVDDERPKNSPVVFSSDACLSRSLYQKRGLMRLL
jgi:hypothetical protein